MFNTEEKKMLQSHRVTVYKPQAQSLTVFYKRRHWQAKKPNK